MAHTLEMILRLLLAAALGSLIGFERERGLWAAGLRTHMLVCVGSCLIMIVSAFGFAGALGEANVILDPSRVAAQVVSGIGFLGAGAILMRGEIVRGLTTAASLWTVAALGLAVGGGLYVEAVASTAIILVILAGIKPLEERYRASRQTRELHLVAERGAISADLLAKTLGGRASHLRRLIVQPGALEGMEDVRITLTRISADQLARIAEELARLPGVAAAEPKAD